MKKVFLFLIIVLPLVAGAAAMAGDCYSDMVVKRWLDERDRAEEHVVQLWARGASPEDFTPDIAVILSNELYVCSKCRNNGEFLAENLHILNSGAQPKVETVPAIIFERLIGEGMLSPREQFPSEKGKGVAAW